MANAGVIFSSSHLRKIEREEERVEFLPPSPESHNPWHPGLQLLQVLDFQLRAHLFTVFKVQGLCMSSDSQRLKALCADIGSEESVSVSPVRYDESQMRHSVLHQRFN